jgi:hypothetical protein
VVNCQVDKLYLLLPHDRVVVDSTVISRGSPELPFLYLSTGTTSTWMNYLLRRLCSASSSGSFPLMAPPYMMWAERGRANNFSKFALTPIRWNMVDSDARCSPPKLLIQRHLSGCPTNGDVSHWSVSVPILYMLRNYYFRASTWFSFLLLTSPICFS